MTEYSLQAGIRAFNVRGWIADHGGDPQAREAVITCPKCGKEKLSINVEKKTWHCWVCQEYSPPDPLTGKRKPVAGAGGLVDLLVWVDNLTRAHARYTIKQAAFYDPLDTDTLSSAITHFLEPSTPTDPVEIAYPECFLPIETRETYQRLPYLEKRRISFEAARYFRLGYCYAGRYAGRLVFPVYERGKLVYWQARAMWEATDRPGTRFVKALNPPRGAGAAVSSGVVFNLDQASRYRTVCLTEGPIDAIRAGADGVCIFGKQLHGRQIAKIQAAGIQRVDVMLDGPGPTEPRGAYDEAIAASHKLTPLFDVRLVWLPRGDPGDYTTAQLGEFRAHAESAGKRADTL